MAERVEDELGPIDVWINNAMATIFGPIEQVSPAEFIHLAEETRLGMMVGVAVGFGLAQQLQRQREG